MNKIAQGIVAATAAILLLAGCSAVSAEAQDAPSVTPSASSEPSATPSAAPSGPVTIAPNQAPAKPTTGTIPNGEQLLVKYLRSDGILTGMEQVSDADLLSAGHYACELFAQGQTYDTMDVIQGDTGEGRNDRQIASLASQTLCIEFDISK